MLLSGQLGRAGMLVVQNVMFTVEMALLMVIAMSFTLISYVPGYRIEGPETVSRFGEAVQTSSLIGSVIGLLFFRTAPRTSPDSSPRSVARLPLVWVSRSLPRCSGWHGKRNQPSG